MKNDWMPQPPSLVDAAARWADVPLDLKRIADALEKVTESRVLFGGLRPADPAPDPIHCAHCGEAFGEGFGGVFFNGTGYYHMPRCADGYPERAEDA